MPTQQDLNDALRSAAFDGREGVIELLLKKGAEIDAQDSIGNTALFVAITKEHLGTAQALLDNGADINARDFNHWTPLMRAAHMGLPNAVRFLLERGAATDCEDVNHQTALILSQWSENSRRSESAETQELLEKWPNVPPRKEKAIGQTEIPARDMAAENLEKLKKQRPKQSPFRKGGP